MKTVRIKKGVKPYGGRRVRLHRRHTHPNGREVVIVYTLGDDQGCGPREYNADEVEDEHHE